MEVNVYILKNNKLLASTYLEYAEKLHRRTYQQIQGEVSKAFYIKSTLPTISYTSGIQYYTFDTLDVMLEHASALNTIRNRIQVFTRMIPADILQWLYGELQNINSYQIGFYATLSIEENSGTVSLIINGTTSFLDAAAITADRTTGNTVVTNHRKNHFYNSLIA